MLTFLYDNLPNLFSSSRYIVILTRFVETNDTFFLHQKLQ